MRQRLAILVLLPCLWLARPTLLAVHAQDPAAPGGATAVPPAGEQPPATPPPAGAADTAAPPADAAPAPPAVKIDKYNDSHSVFRLKNPSISWLKLIGIFILFLMWVK